MQGPALEHTTHAGAHGHACCSASRESSPPHLELMREGTHHTHGGPGASITRWAKRNHGQPRVSRTRVTSRRAIKSGHIIWEHTHVHTHSGFQDIDVSIESKGSCQCHGSTRNYKKHVRHVLYTHPQASPLPLHETSWSPEKPAPKPSNKGSKTRPFAYPSWVRQVMGPIMS